MFGISDKKQQREIQSQIAQRQQLYRRVFDSVDGQAVLKDLAQRCFVNQTTYSDNHGKMGFQEGRRSVYYFITSLLEKDLTQILEELTV